MKACLIDDDYVCNFITENILLEEGCPMEVISFTSAEEALATIVGDLPSSAPDLVFLDLNMPSMSGWEFLDALEPYKDQIRGKCSLYILTSSLDLADTKRSEEYDLVSGFIHKPLGGDDIKVICAEKEA